MRKKRVGKVNRVKESLKSETKSRKLETGLNAQDCTDDVKQK